MNSSFVVERHNHFSRKVCKVVYLNSSSSSPSPSPPRFAGYENKFEQRSMIKRYELAKEEKARRREAERQRKEDEQNEENRKQEYQPKVNDGEKVGTAKNLKKNTRFNRKLNL